MTTYYVKTPANGGSNGNAGTSAGAAWATLQYAADNVSPGDTVIVYPGEYDRFTIKNGSGGTAGNVVTFQAQDQDDRPYIRSEYYNIPYDSLGSTNRNDACIKIEDDYVTFDGFRFTNERAIAIAYTFSGRDYYNITVKNCYFYRVRAVLDMTTELPVRPKAASTMWLSHDGHGYASKNLHLENLEFVECWARRPTDGKGTEIVTIWGAHDGVYVKGCTWTDCYGINLDFLGADTRNAPTNAIGQPRNIVVEYCRFDSAYRTHTPPHVNSLYFDRGTGPAEIRFNEFYCEDTETAPKFGFEKGAWKLADLVPCRRIVFRDNVTVSADYALAVGISVAADIEEGRSYKVEDVAVAHNVIIAANTGDNKYAMQLGSARDIRVTNNVIVNYGSKSTLITSAGSQSASDKASFTAKGNVVWTAASSGTIEWGIGNTMSLPAFNSNVQDGTGWTSKPVFANGISSITASTNLLGYDLSDWTLAAASAGYKDAVPLTYADGAGTSATELVVDDAMYFAPGIPGLGVAGTAIMVGASEAVVKGVNYTTNTISLDRELTWSDDAEIRYKPTTSGVYSVGITSAASENVTPVDPEDPVENILANGYFYDGLDSWWFSAGAGEGELGGANGEAYVQVFAGSSSTQLYQFNLPIASGSDYVLTVYGESDSAPQTITAKVITHADPFTNLGLNDTFELTSSCQSHTLTFTATGSSNNARLQLLFPDAGLATIRGVYLGASGGAVSQCPDDLDGGGSGTPVTQNLKVAASLDDWGDNSATYFGTTDVILAAGGDKDATRYDYRYFARFAISETISQGDTVTAATLRLYRSGDDSGATVPDSRIYAVDSTNSTRPANATASKAQTLTTAYVDWTMANETSEWKTISGLQSIIQELVDSGDLTAGNYITIVVAAKTSGWGGTNTMQYFRTYDYSDGSLAAELTITALTPTAGDGERAFGETFSETFAETWGGW